MQGILPEPDVSYGVLAKEKVSIGDSFKEFNQFSQTYNFV